MPLVASAAFTLQAPAAAARVQEREDGVPKEVIARLSDQPGEHAKAGQSQARAGQLRRGLQVGPSNTTALAPSCRRVLSNSDTALPI